MARAFPGASIFTSVYLPDSTYPEYKTLNVRVLPWGGLARDERQFKLLYLLWLIELQSLNFSGFDVVLSSATYLAKYVRPPSAVRHVSYIYAPFRLLWKPQAYPRGSLPATGLMENAVRLVVPLLRKWDRARTRAIPSIATTCQHMAAELLRVYGRAATVIYPPVEMSSSQVAPGARDDYYLCVGRLIAHKRTDLAVEACTRLGRRLIVVGDGPERNALERMAGPSVTFSGRVSDETLQRLYLRARGLIFPSHEDYGLVPLEAQAHGVPVIAYGLGGVLETVREGVSGVFFMSQTVESLIDGLRSFEERRFSQGEIREWVQRFSPDGFIGSIQELVVGA